MRRFLAALFVLLGLALLSAQSASAHATVAGSNPVDGSRLTTAPKTVEIDFDQAVSIGTNVGYLHVIDQSGKRVDTGSTEHPGGDASKIEVALSSGLGDGTYTASFRIISADSHPVAGAIRFVVGNGALATTFVAPVRGGRRDRYRVRRRALAGVRGIRGAGRRLVDVHDLAGRTRRPHRARAGARRLAAVGRGRAGRTAGAGPVRGRHRTRTRRQPEPDRLDAAHRLRAGPLTAAAGAGRAGFRAGDPAAPTRAVPRPARTDRRAARARRGGDLRGQRACCVRTPAVARDGQRHVAHHGDGRVGRRPSRPGRGGVPTCRAGRVGLRDAELLAHRLHLRRHAGGDRDVSGLPRRRQLAGAGRHRLRPAGAAQDRAVHDPARTGQRGPPVGAATVRAGGVRHDRRTRSRKSLRPTRCGGPSSSSW